ERAHSHGLMVGAHGRNDDEIRKCLAAGVDDFQHLGTAALLPPDIIAAIRERVADERPFYWTPTVGCPINYTYLRRDLEMLDDPAWQRGLPAEIVADVRESLTRLPALLERSPLVANDRELYRRKFEQLRDNGVELLIGTDSGNPGHFHTFALWVELDAWVNHFGVDPMDALRRVTSLAAEVMGVAADYGTVAQGKYADLVVVPGDPLRHIDVLRDPRVVVKHGKRVK